MRSCVWGGFLAAGTAGGVLFVMSGLFTGGSASHCGVCVAPVTVEARPAPLPDPPAADVTDVVDLDQAFAAPPPAPPAGFVSFDEPPLARPPAGGGVIRAGFDEPAAPLAPTGIEVAPMPRPAGTPPGPRLSAPTDPY